MEQFKIYTFKNIRKGEIKRNEESILRLHTNNFTKFEDATSEDILSFKNIINGDDFVTGIVIGCGELISYMSCKIHHKKIDEEFNCPKCPTPLEREQIEKDFRLDMYIEARQEADSKDDMDIREIMVFKRAIKNFL